ncbi:MAG TPA: outer membrane beta-barrel protein [Terriglobales bacterium]|nr:outer membrane beta-barrel protein [Terriglobales bacterium]
MNSLSQQHKLGFWQVILMGMMLASSPFVPAQSATLAEPAASTDPPEAKSWLRGVTTDGYLSLSYTYNTNDPIPPINQFRVFDFNDDEPQLDVAQIVVQHPVSEPGQFGFRVNLIAGSAVPQVVASRGMHIARDFDIPEFYLSYVIPIKKGFRLDLGKFATHFGYEVIGGYDGYNDNFSRGFIFGYGIPFTHTGLKLTYPFSSRISGALLVTNGCDAVTRLNGGLSYGGQVAVVTSNATTLTFNFMHGPEKPHNDYDQRSLYEIVGTWKVLPRLSVAVDGLYADEDHAAANRSDAIWKGLAGYSKYNLTKAFSLAFRGEVFADIGGSRTGTSQTLLGFTLTPEYDLPAKLSRIRHEFKRADGKFALRADFRRDCSDQNTFRKGTGFTGHQFTVAANVVYLF